MKKNPEIQRRMIYDSLNFEITFIRGLKTRILKGDVEQDALPPKSLFEFDIGVKTLSV